MPSVSVWRYGTSTSSLFPTLLAMPPAQLAPAQAPAATPDPAAQAAPTPEPVPTAVSSREAPAPVASPVADVKQDAPKQEEKEQERVEALTATSRRSESHVSSLWRSLGIDRSRR
jgi:hypothetical protein